MISRIYENNLSLFKVGERAGKSKDWIESESKRRGTKKKKSKKGKGKSNNKHNIKMVFRSGKYQGYTIEEVTRIAPWYIRWVKENRPEMLRERPQRKKKKVEPSDDEEVIRPPKLNYYPTWDEAF
jgi:hypothetical protein